MRALLLVSSSLLLTSAAFAQAKAPEDKAPKKPAAAAPEQPAKAAPAPDTASAPAAEGEAAEATAGTAESAAQPTAPAAPAPAPAAQPAPGAGVQLGYGATSYPQAAPAQADQVEEQPRGPKSPFPGWQAFAGLRGAFVGNAGYDPFADKDFMGQGSLGFGRTVFTQGDVSIAGMLYYDGSTETGSARGEATRLALHRVTLGPEVRLHLLPELYVYARPSAGPLRAAARLEEGSTGTTLFANNWLIAVDGFAGAAFELLDASKGSGELRFWVAAEGGYGWSSALDLDFAAEEDDGAAPQRVANVNLGSFAARGPAFRAMVGVSF